MKRAAALLTMFCLLVCICMIGAHAADKVYALTMGVHKYAANHTVSDGSSIAEVHYVRHKDGSEGSADHIYDVEPGEKFTLTTTIKEGQEGFYAFVCWLDIHSEIISYDPVLEVEMDRSQAYFAAYAETANRHLVTFLVTDGEGSISLSSDQEPFIGVGCASVLHGASATIKFAPAKGYFNLFLRVDGERISMHGYSIRSFVREAKDKDLKGMFNVLLNCIKYLIGMDATYTIPSVTKDMLVEVGYFKPYLL